ncbi:MAG: helical backbone metal receptor [Spirochaetota bacterium]|nr:helical backbone metal receptor [Spirochaetota bacterium]
MKILKRINLIILSTLIMFFILFLSREEQQGGCEISDTITRIVSLSPSITRDIIDLESEHMLVGVTSYHPPLSRNVEIVGTLIQSNIEKIIVLNPDIVLLSKEDNSVQNTERLAAIGMKIYTFNRNTHLNDVFNNYMELARIIKREELAKVKIEKYRSRLVECRRKSRDISVAILVSHDPLMAASNLSYIGRMVQDAGGTNIFKELRIPYPLISIEYLIRLNPEIIVSTMSAADEYLNHILNDFQDLNPIKYNNIYSIDPEIICYYTPKNYVESTSILSKIIERASSKRNEK